MKQALSTVREAVDRKCKGMNIIGISGLAGSGKDTAADFLLEHDGFIKISLADPIKRFAMDVWEFTEEQLFGDSKHRNRLDKRYCTGLRTYQYPNAPRNSVWIPLSNGSFTLIDIDNFDVVCTHRWHLNKKDRSTSYAASVIDGEKIKLHQLLLGKIDGFIVDHINGDGLDNRRSNLRLVTQSQNHMNQKKRKDGTSPFKGVGWDKIKGKWRAFIRKDGFQITIGHFNSEEEAALAYDQKAKKLFGEFARTNSDIFLTPRHVLQHLGTEGGRAIDYDCWIRYAIRTAKRLLEAKPRELCYSQAGGLDYYIEQTSQGEFERDENFPEKVKAVIIPDVRFINEVRHIKMAGGKLLRVVRPGAGLQGNFALHQSEIEMAEIPDTEFDSVIRNTGTLDDLKSSVNDFVTTLSH